MLFKSDFDCQTEDCSPDVNCLKCGLYKNKRHPKMGHTGEGKLNCLILGEASGEDEDLIGKQFVGDVGKWFRRKLAGFGLSLDRDFWKINACGCRPTDDRGNNRKPTEQEIQFCKARVLSVIKELKPKFIWLMGNTAIESFYSGWFDKELLTIGKWRRRCIPDPELNAYVIPLWHPSYLSRNEKDLNMQSCYINDLQFAVEQFDNEGFTPIVPDIRTSTNFSEVTGWLDDVISREPKLLFFDYETNCLKPQLKGSAVASISFCYLYDETDGQEVYDYPQVTAFAFPYAWPNIFSASERQKIKEKWIEILANPRIGKAAHACQFENNWSVKHFVEPKGWKHDTQLAAHILDHRRGVYGLKFQSYVKLGIKPYDREIAPYLEADGKNRFNDVFKAPLSKLLTYNGMDTFCDYHLNKNQLREYLNDRAKGGRLYEADRFFLDGALALADMERAGIKTDQPYYRNVKKQIEEGNEELKKKILTDPTAVKFKKQKGRPINIKKNVGADDLRYILENVLRVPIEKVTATDLTATDSEVLNRLKDKYPIIDNIIKLRSGVQTLRTYVMGYLDWAIDDYIYPNITLAIPTSFRSSARNPNIQNVVKRIEYIKKLIRMGIKPRVGRQLGECDFSGIEVAVGCCYHKDPKMISYLTEGGDMHRDAGVDVWMLPANEITKLIRFFLKNQYVFPEFYGSIFANCARGLWETSINLPTTSGEPLREHMRVKGIKTLNEFTEHLKDCENKLWHRFRVYKKWKDNQEIIFRQQGFIETFLGFKYTDYMGYNELSNYPVQGCLQGSSRVLTSNGLVPIKDLVGKVVKVWTGFKWADAVGLNRGRCQLATIWLSSGLKINCDTRHKLKTEKNKWVDFENLKVGDYVALPKNIHPIKPSSNMTWEFVFGYIIGDGILGLRKNGRKYLSMVGGEKKLNLLVKMKEFLENKGLKVRTRIQTYDNPKHKPVFSISVENKRFNRFLEKKGFVFGWKSHTKEIPNCIWHSTAQQQRDFMEGLWLSDGSRNKDHEKNLHMCNRKLLSQVQILISSLGYDSKLPIEESKSYLLSVNWREFNSKSTRRFPRNVLDRAVDFIDKTNYQVENEWITDKRNFNKVQNVTQYVAERIIEKNGDPNFEIYRYDTIEKIEIHEKHEDTYTMSVQDDLHQFVADGVIHRNTAFHVLLWTYIQVNKRRKEEEWRTVIPAEIHDSMVFDFAPKEVDHIIKTVKHIAEVETRKHFEWINIPIKIEAELAPVGASWYDIKPYEVKA